MTIKKITMYETADGTVHKSLAYAEQHEANEDLRKYLGGRIYAGMDAQDIINLLTDAYSMKLVENLFAKNKALEQEVMG